MPVFTHEEVNMFKYVPVRDQLRNLQKRSVQLEHETKQVRADLDFVAVMCDVEIPEDEDQEGGEV